MSISNQIEHYVSRNEREIFADNLVTPFYIFADKVTRHVFVFNVEQKNTIFVHHGQDWCKEGWSHADGVSFREKLFLMGYDSNGVWIRVTVGMLWHLYKEYNVCHPADLEMNVNVGKLSIKEKTTVQKRVVF